ncbi:bifunctional hydroxymethylpyrimidine kinase/phosphomethylpyrimidine kinase [Pseudoflavonifractor sp. 524-17]|nr:bifunctional hydroxymethylpyrimidine kinase/phosphomethylpyrimidine kinase [Pseudoflavonifractor sp. 524-17]
MGTSCFVLRPGTRERTWTVKKVLTIAGSDSSGGAGIQADLKTMTSLGVYGMSAVTALTAQNTTGVYGVLEAAPEFVALQLDCIFQDIRPDAVKIGMVSSGEIIRVIAAKLRAFGAEHIVVDPVMVATSGSSLMQDSALAALTGELFPLAEVITPNLPEAQRLCGFAIGGEADMLRAAAAIGEQVPGGVLLKGGHLTDTADDLLWLEGQAHWFRARRVDNPNNHGSGCTLSSAIASFLALGYPLPEAMDKAKTYITACIEAQLDLGAGSGPLKHNYAIAEGGAL